MADTHIQAIVTGVVWKIEKQPVQPVQAGEVIMILESMKMEIPIEASASGKLKSLAVQEGESVTEGQVVAVVMVDT